MTQDSQETPVPEEPQRPSQTPEDSSAAESAAPDNTEAGAGEVTQEEAHEKEIDLNSLFPEAETDLNSLFPDEEMKRFLKGLSRNKKDLLTLNERFIEENQHTDSTDEF